MEPIKLEDLYAYHFLSEVHASPDGAHVAFVERQGRKEDGMGYRARIHLLDTATGAVRPLTGNGDEGTFRWLDNETLIFPSVRSGDKAGATSFYRLNIHGGEAVKAFTVPLAVKQFHPLPDGRWFVLTRRPMEQSAAPSDRAQLGKDYIVFDELPFWADGIGITNGTRMSGWMFDPTDGSVEQITEKHFDMEGAQVSPDGKKILYWGVTFNGVRPDFKQFMVYDLATRETKSLLPDGLLRTTHAGWWGNEIWTEGGAPHTSVFRSPDLHLIDPETGDRRVFCNPDGFLGTSGIGDMSLGGGLLWKAVADKLYAIRLDHGDTNLLCFDKIGNFYPVASFEGIACFDIAGSDAYLVAFREHRPQELYRLSLESGEITRLTRFHDQFLAEHQVSVPEHITFTSRNGDEVDGWVIKPIGYEPGKKYPGVLNIHGGPKAAYSAQYYHEMQLLAAAGRFVFYTNPHGSDGRGQDYFNIVGKWGTVDYQDFMDFVDTVLERYPDVDSEKLGVCGGSYGGYMTNWIIGHTQRFKAACSMRCISNFITGVPTCDKGYLFLLEHMGGPTIWKDDDFLWEKSPLKHVKNVTTPTLYIHSNTDHRCWMDEPLQMFTSLRQQGVPSKVVLIHNECHELNRAGRPVNRLVRLKALCDWFDQYLK